MAIFVMQLNERQHLHVAFAVDGAHGDHHLLSLAAMRATIHAKRAADAPRNAAIEREA